MCECANVQMVAFICCVWGCILADKALNHLHILTFAHLHINLNFRFAFDEVLHKEVLPVENGVSELRNPIT